ncbi:hypothetical protein GCM10011519_08690 [Marmoricola endophyticus]|uniref:PucR family transcriptional regulator n=1 Tax=Marmoricola endophyticus TaxID=2040280 RepID=A0A917EZM8_9ACTN|nr:helix-turn-helix domain-containing protein [Marmoricola endophyticus]GGF37417.1 hypothetical protein GCM10011519_08690 [Marmoricola endophyticus]
MNNTSGVAPSMDPAVVATLREELHTVGEQVVAVVIAEVPAYRDAFLGPMGQNIEQAVRLALDGFLKLASRGADAVTDAGTPLEPVVEGAYQLGRGEARSGRTMEALLAAYRVGARVAWRSLAERAVTAGMGGEQVASFAELVFAYIDELSAASVAGHSDEAETSGRVRQRLLERLVRQVVTEGPRASVEATARRAEWALPSTVTVVLLGQGQVRSALSALGPRAIAAEEDLPGLERDDVSVLLVPDARRTSLLHALQGRSAVVGPTVEWARAAASYRRAVRTRALAPRRGVVDTDAHLVRLVLGADEEALRDLRARVLAPLDDLREASREKLVETLRAWLLCRGRRDEVAALLHVHPQTVRYRVGQLRELFGETLDDPEEVLALVVALG